MPDFEPNILSAIERQVLERIMPRGSSPSANRLAEAIGLDLKGFGAGNQQAVAPQLQQLEPGPSSRLQPLTSGGSNGVVNPSPQSEFDRIQSEPRRIVPAVPRQQKNQTKKKGKLQFLMEIANLVGRFAAGAQLGPAKTLEANRRDQQIAIQRDRLLQQDELTRQRLAQSDELARQRLALDRFRTDPRIQEQLQRQRLARENQAAIERRRQILNLQNEDIQRRAQLLPEEQRQSFEALGGRLPSTGGQTNTIQEAIVREVLGENRTPVIEGLLALQGRLSDAQRSDQTGRIITDEQGRVFRIGPDNQAEPILMESGQQLTSRPTQSRQSLPDKFEAIRDLGISQGLPETEASRRAMIATGLANKPPTTRGLTSGDFRVIDDRAQRRALQELRKIKPDVVFDRAIDNVDIADLRDRFDELFSKFRDEEIAKFRKQTNKPVKTSGSTNSNDNSLLQKLNELNNIIGNNNRTSKPKERQRKKRVKSNR